MNGGTLVGFFGSCAKKEISKKIFFSSTIDSLDKGVPSR
jgi:hypothetical protein